MSLSVRQCLDATAYGLALMQIRRCSQAGCVLTGEAIPRFFDSDGTAVVLEKLDIFSRPTESPQA
ncbi:MAG: hypothetical protein AAFQ89_00030 [Cyanobacteria bacterium J06626_18]